MTAMQFQGFKPQAMERIAGTLGYKGDMNNFQDFLQSDPEASAKFNNFQNKAIQMMNGGMVRKQYAEGGSVFPDAYIGGSKEFAEQNYNFGGGWPEVGFGDFMGRQVRPDLYGPPANPEEFIDRLPLEDRIGGPAKMDKPVLNVPVIDNQGYKNVDALKVGFKPPSPMTPVTMALESFYNPTTGERVTVGTGGYTAPKGWIRGFPQSVFNPADDPRNVSTIGQTTVDRMQDPRLPAGGVATATGTVAQASQDIAAGAGQVGAASPTATATQGTTAQATADPRTDVSTIAPVTTAGTVESVLEGTGKIKPGLYRNDQGGIVNENGQGVQVMYDPFNPNAYDNLPLLSEAKPEEGVQAAQGTVSGQAQVTGQQQTETAVSAIDATQGTALKMDNPVQRELQAGEIIEPAANAEKASKFTEQIQAATATPSDRATVKGQLDTLMADFEGGNTPAWAAGALRNATAQMAARGLGASSMAGQALVQAAMESALPIASADAQTVAGVEMKNLSNRQERAMLAAQQRATFMGMEFDQAFQSRVANAAKVSDIANMNFTAEQQVALENSRAANTMNLSNLSNRQALTMAEASSLANLDMANLSNRQSAAVMNAQSFLAMDMTNLANQQQTEMFKAQTRTQSMFTDQAADNAAKQFNATSKNQSDQFFANLKTQTSQFNATQANAMKQFNAGEINAVSKFNTEIANQRDQFNAQNSLVVAQSNAVWRREIATAATAAVNRANEINAASVLDMSNQAYANLWQEHSDLMEWAWTSSDNERDRQNAITLSHLAAGQTRSQAQMEADLRSSNAMGDFVGQLILGSVGKIFKW